MAHIPRKLSDADVADIRELLKDGVPRKEIQARYPVSLAYISMIESGKKRKPHLHRIALRSGGTIVFTTNIKNVFDLSEEDQQLLNRLLDLVHEYEKKGTQA